MSWTAVVPLKGGPERKSRLASRLSLADRIALSDAMASHVLGILAQVPAISRILLLSPHARPPVGWRQDQGRGLNAELAALRADDPEAPLLVVHADLPLLTVDDVAALLAAAQAQGRALAPDRHGAGTNALALFASGLFPFAFGEDSCARHAAAGDRIALVHRPGLSLDVDSPDDFAAALAAGMPPIHPLRP